ncbi:MAG: cache domain-containing protein [Betaproteobacteria bacterium]|nr:cache domain-containing protein [Betaproteobacteria bacterium]
MKLSIPRGLFRKYLVFLLILVGGLLSVSSAVELYFSYQETKQSIVRLERTKALAAAREIERYLGEILQYLRGTMQGAIDTSALGTSGIGNRAGGQSRAAALAEQREVDFLRLLRNVPAITDIRHLDLAGKEVLRTSRLGLDAVQSGQDFAESPEFLEAKKKKTYFSPAYLRNESEPYMTMAVAPDETAAEVTAADVNIRAIWDVVARIGAGRAGSAYVVDSKDRLIAHPNLQLVLAKRDLSNLPQVKAARAPAPAARRTIRCTRLPKACRVGRCSPCMRRCRRSAGWCSSNSRSRTPLPRCAPRRRAASWCLRWGCCSQSWRAWRWRAGWSRPSASCRTARHASARATSITGSTSGRAMNSRRSPASSTTPRCSCRKRSAPSSRKWRRAQPSSPSRSSSRPARAKSCG